MRLLVLSIAQSRSPSHVAPVKLPNGLSLRSRRRASQSVLTIHGAQKSASQTAPSPAELSAIGDEQGRSPSSCLCLGLRGLAASRVYEGAISSLTIDDCRSTIEPRLPCSVPQIIRNRQSTIVTQSPRKNACIAALTMEHGRCYSAGLWLMPCLPGDAAIRARIVRNPDPGRWFGVWCIITCGSAGCKERRRGCHCS